MSIGQLQGQVIENLILQNKAKKMWNTSFYGILTGKSLYGIMFVIQNNFQDQKVIFAFQYLKKIF